MEREILDIIIGKLRQIPQLDIQIIHEPGKVEGLPVDAKVRIHRGGITKNPAVYIAYKEMMAGV